MARAVGPACEILVYRYTEHRKRVLVTNVILTEPVEWAVRNGHFGDGAYRLEWRDANRLIVKARGVRVGPGFEKPRLATPAPRPRLLPPPTPLPPPVRAKPAAPAPASAQHYTQRILDLFGGTKP